MGYFKNIELYNYRNFSKFFLNFESGSNIILGKNGSGKTNILEALSLFEKGRGLRKERIHNLINFQNNEKGFKINSIFESKKSDFDISISNSEKNLKTITVNNSNERDTIQHFQSLFSVIVFLPEMERMFIASPSFRRNFLDRLIFNSNKNYNTLINNYKKAIGERQLLLKNNNYDESWIAKIENNIVEFGSIIYQKRNSHIQVINKILKKINDQEHFANNFFLKINDDFLENNLDIFDNKDLYLSEIKDRRKIDLFSGGCTIGPHRSDISGFHLINNFNLNQLSTGQQKTIVLLIIISQSIFLINDLKLQPIILLDEICSHLDDVNRKIILYLINDLKVQVFMTGAEKSFFSFLSTKANYCNIT